MTFSSLSFARLFHSDFRLEAQELFEHALLLGEIRRFAEASLLAELLEASDRSLPEVSEDEAQDFFNELRISQDYIEDDRAEQMLDDLGIDLDELSERIVQRIAVDKLVDERIRDSHADPERRDALLWQMFLDGSLRSLLVRACSMKAAGHYADPQAEPSEQRRAQRDADRHIQLRHGLLRWAEVEHKLVERWGLPEDSLAELRALYGKAVSGCRSGD